MRAVNPSFRPSPAGGVSPAAAAPDPYRWTAYAMAAVFTLTLPAILAVVVFLQPDPGARTYRASASGVGMEATPGGGGSAITPASLGQATYAQSCAVCHGPDGFGVHSLGKPLRNSAFVQEQSDEQLVALITDGRKPSDPGNTTGALMPARGAQSLSDEKIDAVVAYLRSMQEPGVDPVSMDPWNLVGRDNAVGTVGAIELTGHAGYELYVSSCSACHGQGAEGIEDLGLPLTTSGFVRGTSDADLVRFIKSGRASWDANNSTGIDMPPKGGNPAFSDDQLQTIVEYIRALQAEAMGSSRP
jgi:mono/diheme cytochrome c family protein